MPVDVLHGSVMKPAKLKILFSNKMIFFISNACSQMFCVQLQLFLVLFPSPLTLPCLPSCAECGDQGLSIQLVKWSGVLCHYALFPS